MPGGTRLPEREIQGQDVSACPLPAGKGLGMGGNLFQQLFSLLQYIFVSLISRDSVYDVLRRVCTHLQVPLPRG